MHRMLCFMLLFVLTGCSGWNVVYAPVPLNTSNQETAEVVVIRDMTYFSGQLGKSQDNWVIAVDNRNYAGLRPGQYTMFPVSVDKSHHLAVKHYDIWWHDSKIQVILEPGQRYYYLVGVTEDHLSAGIKQISAEEGQAWVAKSHYVQVANPK